ncbi:MAG: cytochrome c biogenesis protein ResB [Planctomycetes bacterium]|nr:cytochrome c biogenesis protein ResB [Planctomycetota bacterium]
MKDSFTAKAPAPSPPATDAITAKAPNAFASLPLEERARDHRPNQDANPVMDLFWMGVKALASLRLTVALFALAIVLVFYGTWAQVDSGIWTVMSKYFRSYFVMIPLHVVLLRTIDPVPVGIPFPGGWLLGGLLLANLIAAHLTRFRVSWKRSGILILHGGLILLMIGELVTGLYAVEGNLTFVLGQTVNYIDHPLYPELAIMDESDPKVERGVVVPVHYLDPDRPIANNELLPFDVETNQYMANSRMLKEMDPAGNPATAGVGLRRRVRDVPEGSGTDSDQKIDTPSAYITLKEKGTGRNLGTYLVSYLIQEPQWIESGGKKWNLSLRFKRTPCEFSMQLLKADHDKWPGTEKPKNYASTVRLVDPKRGEDREIRISMNSPLRESGLTFYQSGMQDLEGTRLSILQVVRNPGWWIPYASCTMVILGMLIHFGLNLTDFISRKVLS